MLAGMLLSETRDGTCLCVSNIKLIRDFQVIWRKKYMSETNEKRVNSYNKEEMDAIENYPLNNS